MIKINLLNTYKEAAGGSSAGASGNIVLSDDDEKKKILTEFAKRALVVIIGPLALYIYEMQTLPELQREMNTLNARLAEMQEFNNSKQDLANEIKKYEQEQEQFNAQMDFINKITRDKVNEYKLFQHLKDSTPENVWINKLELMDNLLTITAESDDSKEIEKFIQRLSNADFISNLVPLSQTNKKDFYNTGVDTTVFTVRAQMNSDAAGGAP
ncbi:PilN domain-containing protein [Pseudobdellovibrio exovorus]|uniref:Fimbrial assembly membrane protein n=1 Tax=Pseudobdellovibrio exovorus JSS TaxID=1184267 RepID=M4VPD2_9BACT|nr:PilN domain-containing protein [Pseudobdellovibrio exovorus]AGH94974.1 fimbrial assembly membrane protein [Pseudobdellovibrio exovorus JSS]